MHPPIVDVAPISLVAHPEPELLSMRGIASRLVISSLLPSKPKLGKSLEITLLLLTSVWILVSWDWGRLHTSNTPVSSAIGMATMTSTLTGTYCCHPHPLTLIITRKYNRMIFFNQHPCRHQFIENLTSGATRKGCVNWWCWDHNGNICWTFQSSFFRNTWFRVGLEVQGVVQQFISIFKLQFSTVKLKDSISLSLNRQEWWSYPPGK